MKKNSLKTSRTHGEVTNAKCAIDKDSESGTGKDITKGIVKALQESEERFRIISEMSPTGLYLCKPNGECIYVNPRWCEMSGLTFDEALGTGWINGIYPEDRQLVFDSWAKMVESNGHWGKEYRFQNKEGKITWVYGMAAPQTDKDGNIVGYVGVNTDITERKQTESLLEEKTRLSKTLLDAFPCIALLLRPSTREIVASNQAAVNVGAVPGAKCFSTWGQSKTPCPWCLAPKLWSTGESQHIVVDGLGVIWEAHWIPVSEDLYMHYAFDITEKKKMQDALARTSKLESLGILAGGIAHDFNNLMNGIFGYIEMANAVSDSEKRTGYLEKAISTMDRARGLTAQLLTFAKGGAPVQKVIPLTPFIHETVQFALSGSNCSARFDIPAHLWQCNIDKNQIAQVIENIVINAQQAMPDGGTIEISAENISLKESLHMNLSEGDFVRLSIKDSGIGMQKDMIAKIFDPFYTTKTKGHGLGLTTSHSIIKRHGGTIEVTSTPGGGSTFYIYMPAVKEATVNADTGIIRYSMGKGTVLLMDDEAVIRETAKTIKDRMKEHR